MEYYGYLGVGLAVMALFCQVGVRAGEEVYGDLWLSGDGHCALGVVEFDGKNHVLSIKEIAGWQGFMNDTQLQKLGEELKTTEYGQYLLPLIGG